MHCPRFVSNSASIALLLLSVICSAHCSSPIVGASTDAHITVQNDIRHHSDASHPTILGIHTQDIQEMILQYVDETLNRRTYQLLSGLTLVQKNMTLPAGGEMTPTTQETGRDSSATTPFDVRIVRRLRRFADTHVINLSVPRALQATAKTFFFKSKSRPSRLSIYFHSLTNVSIFGTDALCRSKKGYVADVHWAASGQNDAAGVVLAEHYRITGQNGRKR